MIIANCNKIHTLTSNVWALAGSASHSFRFRYFLGIELFPHSLSFVLVDVFCTLSDAWTPTSAVSTLLFVDFETLGPTFIVGI
jgi:hypothetical protein